MKREDIIKLREALQFYADGNHIVNLHGKIDWTAERAKLHDRGFSRVCEAYNGEETFVEDGRKALEALALPTADHFPDATKMIETAAQDVAEALKTAIDRLEDLLRNDDGQAWKEAEKALPRLHDVMFKAIRAKEKK